MKSCLQNTMIFKVFKVSYPFSRFFSRFSKFRTNSRFSRFSRLAINPVIEVKNSKKGKPQLFYTQSELGHQILAFNSKILGGESKRSWSNKRHPISLFIYYNYTAMIHISIITFLQYSTFRGTQGSYTWKLDAKKFFRHPPLPPISHHFDTQTFWLQNCMTSNYDILHIYAIY